MTRYSRYIKFLNIFGDVALLNSAYIIAFYIKFGAFHPPFLAMLFYVNVVWVLVTSIFKPYKLKRTTKFHQVLRLTYTILFFHILLVFAYYVFEQTNRYSRELLVLMYSILAIAMFCWKIGFILFLRWFRKKGFNYRNVVLVIDKDNPVQIKSYIESHNELGYRIIKVFEPDQQKLTQLEFSGELLQQEIKQFCQENTVHEIFYAMSSIHHHPLVDLMNFAEENFIKMRLIADFKSILFRTLELEHFDLIPILSVVSTPLDNAQNQIIKRSFDIVFSFLVIVFLLSWLIPILAIIIKLNSEGPVFFRQQRTGRGNKSFLCYKLRSMVVNELADSKQATKEDNRITSVGRFLRDTSLDELPQFFNVLFGSMSVVGPRPHMLKHTEEFSSELETFMFRHKIKPGITGLAQTKGYRGETDDFEKLKNRVKMDFFYIKNWSFLFDLAIIVNTVLAVFKNSNDEN